MVIIYLTGGLGSEMFKYALYRKYQELGKEAVCDIRDLKQLEKNGFPTINFFPNVNIKVAKKEEIKTLGDISHNFLARMRRRVFHIHKKSHIIESEKDKQRLCYRPEIFYLDNVYLVGWWQSELYFRDIREKLLNEFCFPENCGTRNKELALKMNDEVSVSLHIRRGDYLKGKNKESYGGVCTDRYYKNAVSYFKEKYPNAHFYIFSNDPVWAMEKYRNINMTVVNWNMGKDSSWDMYLMTQCKHNVIANSTFSWWGGWLNQHEGKEIVAPAFWFNPKCAVAEDIIPGEWKKIEG